MQFSHWHILRLACPIVWFGIVSASAASNAEPTQPIAGDDRSGLKNALAAMARDGQQFDPQPLVKQGVAGMRAVLDHCFPESAPSAKTDQEDIRNLIEQLGDESFDVREQAAVKLQRLGRGHQQLLRDALDSDDAEVRFRLSAILKSFQRRTAVDTDRMQKTCRALEVYLGAVDDLACQQELARRVTTSLQARLDQSEKAQLLQVCLAAMAQWKVDLVHEELLPLLEHEDPAVAIFAMRGIGGRTGNSYIAPIHLGAIESGRRELVKVGLRSMPCPIWDRQNKPRVHKVYNNIFEGDDPFWDFSDDDVFMQTSAFVAARDFHIPEARDWPLRRMASDDERQALRAIQSLGDTYYMRRPIYPELLAALEPHLNSDDAQFRQRAIYTVGVYQGEPVPALLLAGLADREQAVWQTAGRRLADQHRYHPAGKSPIPTLLKDAMDQSSDEQFKARAAFLLEHLQQERPGYLLWPKKLP